MHETLYHLLFSSIPFPTWVIDVETLRFLEVNEAAVREYGYTREEFLAMETANLRATKAEFVESAALIRAGEFSNATLRHRRKDGSIFDVEITSRRFPIDGRDARLAVAVDVSERVRAGKALAESEARLSHIVERANDIIYNTDARGRFTFVNTAVTRVLGYRPDQVLGLHFLELIGAEQRAWAREFYQQQMLEKTPNTYLEFPAITANGEEVWIGQSVQTVLRDGELVGFQAVARDITERRRAEMARHAAEERFRVFMDNTPALAFIKDEDGNYVYANPAMKRLFLVDEADQLEVASVDYGPADQGERVRREDAEVLASHATMQFVEQVITRDGRTLDLLVAKFPVTQASGRILIGGIAVDVTEQKRLESELAAARDVALESAQLKSEFLANMSHEIRTPLNGVIGMLGLLMDTSLTSDQRELADVARTSGEALLTIINDILDFSKIEAGKLSFEMLDFDLRYTVEGALDLLGDAAQAKGLEIATLVYSDVPNALRGDPGRLRQVLLNLVSNAVKFTERGEIIIRVRLESATEDRVLLRFSITDSGIGISSAGQERLFSPFTQADGSTTRKYGGTGLGLAISRQLATLMGGAIGVDSTEGRGSTFWFTAGFERQPGQEAPLDATPLVRHRAVIVDDNATNRLVLRHHLSAWGIEHAEAADGEEALAKMREAARTGSPFTIGLLDMQMPGMDGLALAERIKSDPAIAATRLVLISSQGIHRDRETLERVGISASISKPVKEKQLRQILEASPAADRHAQPAAPATSTGPASLRARILVAEDNVVNQKVALRQLLKLGYSADAVGNGSEALEAVHRIAYDAILMDCQMPEMDGYTATRLIRSQEKGSRIPIIAMTANALDGDRERCLEAGMDDYISKPVRENELAAVLEKWAGSGQ